MSSKEKVKIDVNGEREPFNLQNFVYKFQGVDLKI